MAEDEPIEPASPLDRRRLAVGAAVLGLVGFLAGAGLNQGLKGFLAVPEDEAERTYVDKVAKEPEGATERPAPTPGGEAADSEPPAGRGRASSERTYTDAIVRRNIFDSSAVYDPDAQKGDGNFECKESKARLVGTMVSDVPEYSSALISDGGSKDARAVGYVIGDDLSGEGRIVTIDQNRVCLEGGTCLCIGQEGKPVADAGSGEATDGGVEKLSDNKYRVSQSFLNDALANVEALATKVRAVPHKGPDGEIDGFRLSAIRKGTLFEKLGIKNGDIIHTVNGSPLTSAESALSSYTSLKNEKSFSFEVTRRNQRQTLEYEVR